MKLCTLCSYIRQHIRWIMIVLTMGVATGPLFAQGFQVKPMLMEFTAPAGRSAETVLELSNTTTENLNLDVRLVELGQTIDGSWQLIEPDSGNRHLEPLFRPALGQPRDWVR